MPAKTWLAADRHKQSDIPKLLSFAVPHCIKFRNPNQAAQQIGHTTIISLLIDHT
jgi:hypothetical protein